MHDDDDSTTTPPTLGFGDDGQGDDNRTAEEIAQDEFASIDAAEAGLADADRSLAAAATPAIAGQVVHDPCSAPEGVCEHRARCLTRDRCVLMPNDDVDDVDPDAQPQPAQQPVPAVNTLGGTFTPTQDASPAAAAADHRLRGKISEPDDTSDLYMVLWAWKPPRGERPRYEEVGYIAASTQDLAKARALEHDGRSKTPIAERGDVAQFLIARAEERGILLRAVPARYWPAAVDVTGMVRPDPILTIR